MYDTSFGSSGVSEASDWVIFSTFNPLPPQLPSHFSGLCIALMCLEMLQDGSVRPADSETHVDFQNRLSGSEVTVV